MIVQAIPYGGNHQFQFHCSHNHSPVFLRRKYFQKRTHQLLWHRLIVVKRIHQNHHRNKFEQAQSDLIARLIKWNAVNS